MIGAMSVLGIMTTSKFDHLKEENTKNNNHMIRAMVLILIFESVSAIRWTFTRIWIKVIC